MTRMPRQIIDTQSSRPAYVRRRLIQIGAVVLILAGVGALCLLVWHGWRPSIPGM